MTGNDVQFFDRVRMTVIDDGVDKVDKSRRVSWDLDVKCGTTFSQKCL